MGSIRLGALVMVLLAGAACGDSTSSVSDSSSVSPPSSLAPSAPTSGAGSTASERVDSTTIATTPASGGSVLTVAPAAGSSEWQVRALGPVSPDGGVAMVEHGGDVWVGRPVGDDYQFGVSIIGAASTRDVELDYHQPVIAVAMASTPVGVVLVVSGVDDFVPYVWLSSDGETWSAGTITDAAFDVAGVVWVDGRFIASGSKRVGDNPSMGPFEAALFESSDGIEWSEIVVDDGFGGDGFLSAPVVVGDRLVVTGQFSGEVSSRTVMFESLDAGVTWHPANDEGPVPSQLASIGGVLVGSGVYDPEGGGEFGLVLNRAGRWETVGVDDLVGPSQFTYAYLVGQGRDAAVFVIDYERPVEYCYEDPDSCQSSSPLTVSVASDGTTTLLDLGVEDPDVDTAATGSDGTFHVLLSAGLGLELRTWPAEQGPLPTLPTPTINEPQGPPVVEWDAELEIGETYRFPLYTHCGIDVLGRFNGLNWWLRETPLEDFTGNGGSVLGEIHVIAADQIDYVLDGVTVAVYEPRPDEFPGCD